MHLLGYLGKLGSVLLVVALTSSCGDDPVVATASLVTEPAPLSSARLAFAIEKANVPGSLPSTHWIAEVHADAMQEVLANGAALKTSSIAQRCAFVARVLRKRFATIQAKSGATSADMEAALSASLLRGGCKIAVPNSVFGLVAASPSLAASGDSVTGAYEAYVPAIEAAAEGYSNPTDAAHAISSILRSAISLPAADYEVLSGIASMTVSDLYYWYDVEASGGCGSCGGDEPPEYQELRMSVFGTGLSPHLAVASMGRCGFWCRAGWSDLVGGAGAAAGVLIASGGTAAVAPPVLLASFTAGAVTASALYAISAF